MDASDAMALLYLLRRADVEVTAIVVDGDGEARCPIGATNALSLAALAGKPDIPVGGGRPRPLKGAHAFPKAWRNAADNLYGLPRPARPARPPAGPGASAQAALRSAPGRVNGVDARAADRARRRSSSRRDSAQGQDPLGDHDGRRGRRPREHHMAPYDREPACRMELLRRSESGERRVPLWATDHTRPARRDERRAPERGRRRAAGRSPSAAFVRRLIGVYPPSLEFYFWDQLAAAVLVGTDHRPLRQQAARRHRTRGPQSGRTVRAADGARVRVTMSADRARFERSFTSTLR